MPHKLKLLQNLESEILAFVTNFQSWARKNTPELRRKIRSTNYAIEIIN